MNSISLNTISQAVEWELIIDSPFWGYMAGQSVSQDHIFAINEWCSKLEPGDAVILPLSGVNYLIVKGPDTEVPGKWYMTLRKIFYRFRKQVKGTLHLRVDFPSESTYTILEALCQAFYWGDFSIRSSMSDEQPGWILNIISEKEEERILEMIQKLAVLTLAQKKVAEWVNMPSNLKYPAALMEQLDAFLSHQSVSIQSFKGEELLVNNLHAIHGVGKASEHSAGLFTANYTHPAPLFSISLIGKGVTFDTGGISIKPSSNMHFMKSDMAGAAMMAGVFYVISQLGWPVSASLVLPLAENAVAGNALKPGDILNSYSGKTIEVIDTDAEGRLILADALAYAVKNYPSDYLIDAATLTGSSVATLGYEAAALFTRNAGMENGLRTAGALWDEKVWPLPLWDEYKEDLHSDVADIRNFSGKPVAGAITAAKFLEVFTDAHPAWAHLDIAGVAFKESEFGKMRNATAYGVRLILQFIEDLLKTKAQ
jgi:leucyl aminopeptidase